MSVAKPLLIRTGERLETAEARVTLSTDKLPECEITLADDPGVAIHDLMEVYTNQGSAGLFRVTDRSKTYGDQITLTMRGALDTLSDDIYAQETTLRGTVATVLGQVLAQQTTVRWQLGTCARSDTIKLEVSYTSLLDLMDTIRSGKTGYWWRYDYTTTPWTVSLEALPEEIVSEFRLGRNISSASVDLSDADLCTRLYMTVSTDSASTLYTYNNTDAQAQWGVISRTADVDAEDVSDPAAYGAAILAERAQPIAYITVDGYDLHELTGDDFDRITLGKLCRVSMEGFAGTFSERVTKIEWPDAIGRPEEIKVGLASVVKSFREQLKLIRKTGSGAAKKAAEASESITQLVNGLSATAFNTSTAYAIGDYVTYNDHTYKFTAAHQAGAWTGTDVVEVTDVASLVSQAASEWSATVSEVQTARGSSATLRSALSLKADSACLSTVMDSNGRVTAASIATAINATTGTSKVIISADHIDLQGYVTAAELAVMDLYVASVQTDAINVGGECTIDNEGYIDCAGLTVNGTDFDDIIGGIADVQISGPTNNTYTLQVKKYGDTTWTDAGTFSRATTLTGAWASGTYTVSASPQGDTISTTPALRLNGLGTDNFTAELLQSETDQNVQKSVTGYLAMSGSGTSAAANVYTGRTGSAGSYTYSGLVASLSVGSLYTEGVNAAKPVTIATPTWQKSGVGNVDGTNLLTISASSAGGGSDTEYVSLSLTADSWLSDKTRKVKLFNGATEIGLYTVDATGIYEASEVSLTATAAGAPTYNSTAQRWYSTVDVTKTLGATTDTESLTVDVQAPVNTGAGAGWASAAGAVVWPSAGSAAAFDVTVPDSAWGDTASKTFTLSQSGSYVYANDGTDNVARVAVSGGSYVFSCPEQAAANYTDSISGYLNCGSISKSATVSRRYIKFRIKCDSAYKYCYISVND